MDDKNNKKAEEEQQEECKKFLREQQEYEISIRKTQKCVELLQKKQEHEEIRQKHLIQKLNPWENSMDPIQIIEKLNKSTDTITDQPTEIKTSTDSPDNSKVEETETEINNPLVLTDSETVLSTKLSESQKPVSATTKTHEGHEWPNSETSLG